MLTHFPSRQIGRTDAHWGACSGRFLHGTLSSFTPRLSSSGISISAAHTASRDDDGAEADTQGEHTWTSSGLYQCIYNSHMVDYPPVRTTRRSASTLSVKILRMVHYLLTMAGSRSSFFSDPSPWEKKKKKAARVHRLLHRLPGIRA